MLPEQQPHQPTQPNGSGFTPQAPHYDYGTAPQDGLQQHPSGQYEVVPALSQNPGRASGHNPYEFIMEPNTPKSKLGLPRGGGFSWRLLALLGGGLVVVMIIVAVVLSSLAPKGSVPGLTIAAQREQEIIRLAGDINKNATGQDLLNLAANTQISVMSSQKKTLAFLAGHGAKLKTKQLNVYHSAQTGTLLANAATAGTYDTVAMQNLVSQLETYQALLQSTYKQTTNASAKTLLQTNFSTANKLLAQAEAISASNN